MTFSRHDNKMRLSTHEITFHFLPQRSNSTLTLLLTFIWTKRTMACKLLRNVTHFLTNHKLTHPSRCTTLSKMKFPKHQQTSLISFPSWQGIHLEAYQNGYEIKNKKRSLFNIITPSPFYIMAYTLTLQSKSQASTFILRIQTITAVWLTLPNYVISLL